MFVAWEFPTFDAVIGESTFVLNVSIKICQTPCPPLWLKNKLFWKFHAAPQMFGESGVKADPVLT
jgi:hypothetical protein